MDYFCYNPLQFSIFLYKFASQIGYISGRDIDQGSIFIQELCKVINNRWKDDLSTIASYVNRNIMREYQFQAPEIINQLGDLVFFKGVLNDFYNVFKS